MPAPLILANIELELGFEKSFEQYILGQIVGKLRRKSKVISQSILEKLKDVVRDRLFSSDAYRSLLGGSLQGHLGIPDPSSRASAIIEAWVEGISVVAQIGSARGGSSKGLFSLEIGVIQADYADVLSMTESEYDYYSDRFEQLMTIPWLQWLLLEGDRKIIKEFGFMRPGGINVGRSRTGLGLMREGKGLAWQVPAEFSGTAERNFATEALASLDEDIGAIVSETLERNL